MFKYIVKIDSVQFQPTTALFSTFRHFLLHRCKARNGPSVCRCAVTKLLTHSLVIVADVHFVSGPRYFDSILLASFLYVHWLVAFNCRM